MNFINLLLAVLFSGFIFSQAQTSVDFYRAAIHIIPGSSDNSINGKVTYWFNVLEKTDSVFLDAKNMDFSSVLVNGKKVHHTNTKDRIVIYKKLKAGKSYNLTLDYYEFQSKRFTFWVGKIPFQIIIKYGRRARENIPVIGSLVLMI